MTDAPKLNAAVPNAIDLVLSRRSGSAKRMTGPGPSPEQLDTILTAAARVPDHGKLFPWRFIVFEGEHRAEFGNLLAQIVELEHGAISPERKQIEHERFSRAPVVVAVISSPKKDTPIPDWEQRLSAGAVCMNMLTAAHAMGFVANWITEWTAYHPAVLEMLHIWDEEKIAGFIYIGQPAEPLAERVRPDMKTLIKRYHR
jgi:nitroreductase